MLDVNLYGAIYTALAFLPLVKLGREKKIIYVSSSLGSLQLNLYV